MQKNKEEQFYLLQKLASKSGVVSKVQMLKLFLDNYKQIINESTHRPDNILNLQQEVDKKL